MVESEPSCFPLKLYLTLFTVQISRRNIGFLDAREIGSDAIVYLFMDLQEDEKSILRRTFGISLYLMYMRTAVCAKLPALGVNTDIIRLRLVNNIFTSLQLPHKEWCIYMKLHESYLHCFYLNSCEKTDFESNHSIMVEN